LPPGFLQAVVLIALLAAYGFFLVLGTFVHTAPLAKDLAQEHFRPSGLFVMLTCWTWTNLLVLCCLSAVIGELGRRVLLGSGAAASIKAAIIRGFFILLVLMAGHFVILGTPGATAIPQDVIQTEIGNAGPHRPVAELYTHICLEHFFRLAGFASLVSFIVSIDPRLFKKIIDRIDEGFRDEKNNQHP
jgi:hypothetical protein